MRMCFDQDAPFIGFLAIVALIELLLISIVDSIDNYFKSLISINITIECID